MSISYSDIIKWGLTRRGNAILRRKWLTWASLGDSILAPESSILGDCYPYPAGTYVSENYSHAIGAWMHALSKRQMRLIHNGGHSGERSAYVLTQADAALAGSPDMLLELCGINDITQYETAHDNDIAVAEEAIISNRVAIWDRARLRGTFVVALSLPPIGNLSGFTTAMRICVQRVNRRLKDLAAVRPDVKWIDIYAIGVDGTHASAYPKANHTPDALHPGTKFVAKIAQAINTAIADRFDPASGLVASALDSTFSDDDSTNIMVAKYGLFIDTTTGSAGTGVTGDVPTSFTVDRGSSSGAPTAVCSVIDAADGVGKALRVVATAANAGEYIRILTTLNGNITSRPPGTMFELGCNIDVSDQTNLRGITGIAQLTFSGGSSSSPLSSRAFLIGATPGAYGPDDAAFSMRMAIPPAIVPADATGFTSCRGELQIVFAGAGEATVDISRFTAIMTLPG